MEKLFILDFDGVIAFLFENYDLKPARKEMNECLLSYGVDASEHDNMFTVSEVIAASGISDSVKHDAFIAVDRILRRCEMEAIEVAETVPGFMEVFPTLKDLGIDVAIASNNNPDAVKSFLRCRFPSLDIPVFGRDSLHPERLKPASFMLDKARELYGASRENTFFFGDAVSDMEAAVNAGVGFYGFIPSEKKRIRMEKVLPKSKLLLDWFVLEDRLLH